MGYTACHWCHVMNEESFNDAETAAYINEHFIPVIVDREDRPDLDMVYQGAAQVMGHTGGWPLNSFLNPKGVPFYISGFLPKTERLGQPAIGKVLSEVTAIWHGQPQQVVANTNEVLQRLENFFNRDMRAAPESIALDPAALRVGQRFDIFLGGMMGQMKFPSVTLMEVLWRAFLRSAAPQFHQLVTTALDNMLMGGPVRSCRRRLLPLHQ